MFKSFTTILLLIIIIGGIFGGLYFNHYVKNGTGTHTQPVNIVVPKGANLATVSEQLQEADIITHTQPLFYYFWKEKLRGKLIAGEYMFQPKVTVPEIAFMLTTGKVERDEVKVTFPEGWTMADMAVRLAENGFDGDTFLALAKEPTAEIRAAHPFLPEGHTLEGYLFPDTYLFASSATPEVIIDKMLATFELKVDDTMLQEIDRQGKTLHEVITLASVVEGEVRSVKDRKVVAGIFYNRLENRWPLQSDATLTYALGGNKIKHTLKDLEFDSPYNSYKYPGLPPGPVLSPGVSAIEATIYPDTTEFFFFLNNPKTGETFFAQTLDEHVVNKNKNGL